MVSGFGALHNAQRILVCQGLDASFGRHFSFQKYVPQELVSCNILPQINSPTAAQCGFLSPSEAMNEAKNPNPKDAIGASKVALSLWPETATIYGALGLLDGAAKYGRCNWRATPVRASIYIDAARRHMAAWFDGEDFDPESGVPHLGHALACLAILVDAEAAGTLIDDRNVQGGYRALVDRMTPFVARIQARHAGKTPHHYTIADNEPEAKTAFPVLDATLGVSIDDTLSTLHRTDLGVL